MKRDSIELGAAQMRIDAQPDERFYRDRADILIRNDGDNALDKELDLL